MHNYAPEITSTHNHGINIEHLHIGVVKTSHKDNIGNPAGPDNPVAPVEKENMELHTDFC